MNTRIVAIHPSGSTEVSFVVLHTPRTRSLPIALLTALAATGACLPLLGHSCFGVSSAM